MSEFEERVSDYHSTMLLDMQNDLFSLNDNSFAALDFKKWEIKRHLDDYRNDILRMIGMFDEKVEIHNTISRTENSITTVIEIFSQIETYKQRIELTKK